MPIVKNEYNARSRGGTELSISEFERHVDADLLSKVNIYPSRIREEIDTSKANIYWVHDLPGDPEMDHLKNGGWNKFDKIVFVSNWQLHKFIDFYGMPWYKCAVLPNAIEPSETKLEKDLDTIKLIYHTTPHRGLNILIPVFKKLAENFDNIELDVFSSLKVYGWDDRDKQFEPLYDECRNHPKIRYHAGADYSTVREAVDKAHIFSYPNTWQETGCRALMEAMSAGCLCVHPNYGALYETAAGWSWMYQWNESVQDHANAFYANLAHAIQNLREEGIQSKLHSQKSYADVFYSWKMRGIQWSGLIESVLRDKRII